MAGNYTTTTNFGLHALLGNSKVSDVDEGFAKLAGDIDAKMVGYVADTFAKRPAAGIPNREFRATDTGVLYRDNGTTWDVMSRGVGAESWGAVAANGTVFDGSGDYAAAKLAQGWYRFTWTKAKPTSAYGVIATCVGLGGGQQLVAIAETVIASRFDIRTYANGTIGDAPFSFIVVAST